MKIKYNLLEEDYVNFNIFHMKNSKTVRKSIMINRYITPLIFLIVPFVLKDMLSIPFWYWEITFIATFILWIVFYERNLYSINRKRIKKMLKENSNDGLIGERILEIVNDKIKVTTEYGENIVDIKSIKNILENDKYIILYTSSVSAIIIPVIAFESEEEKNNLINMIKIDKINLNRN